MSEEARFALYHCRRYGTEGYPIMERGGKWYVMGIRGLGKLGIGFDTREAAVSRWELFLDALREQVD